MNRLFLLVNRSALVSYCSLVRRNISNLCDRSMDRQTTYNSKTRIWSGKSAVPLYDFNCSVGRIAFEQMKNWPTKVIQINDVDGCAVTNQEALTWAIRIAQHFESLGLSQMHIVGIIGNNTMYQMSVVTACLMNATAFHTVNPNYEENLICHLFGITKPTVIFCDAEIYNKVHNATKEWEPIIYTLDERVEGVQNVRDLLEPTETENSYQPAPLIEGGAQTMAILCSSGTTGQPKAVCISNSKLHFKTPVTSADVIFSQSGLDWLTGIWILMLSITRGCTRIITNKSLTPEHLAEIYFKYRVTATIAPPRVISLMLSNPQLFAEKLISLRTVLCGGAAFSPDTLERFAKLVHKDARFIHCYGMTEIGIAVMNTTGKNLISAGMLDDGISAVVVDSNGEKLGPNETGELLIHLGRHQWNGYYNNAQATAETKNADGWISTGDIAYFNEEGYLYVVDRKKDILKNQGTQYWPSEIESVIAKIPDVVEVCVVGIYDEKSGDVPGALVRKLPNSSLDTEKVQAYVAERLQSSKHLSAGVVFLDKLPHNHNNKVLRKEAKELFVQLNKRK